MSEENPTVDSEFVLLTLSEARIYFTGAMSPRTGQTFPLSKERPNIIGRKDDVTTICIKDGAVAFRHCAIIWCVETGNFNLADIDARKNSTAVNGVCLKQNETVSVQPSDEVRCGRTVFRIQQLRQAHPTTT